MENKTQQLQSDSASENRFFRLIFAGLLIFLALVASLLAGAQKYQGHYLNNVDANGVILDGYDPVAFFTEGKPVKGNPEIRDEYEEATYYFASQEHRDLFHASPEKYKPQFGAWCAYAVSLGRTAPIDVNTFSIINGRLVIQHNQKAVNGWNKNPPANLELADTYWPKVTANGGKQIKTAAGGIPGAWIAAGAVLLLAITGIFINRRICSRHRDLPMQTDMKTA